MSACACRVFVLLLLCSVAATAVLAQKSAQPTASPAPRRPLPKPVSGTRGFEQFAQRDASARLIAAAGTRVIIDPDDHYTKGEEHYKASRYKETVAELREAVRLSPDWDDPHYVLALALTELGQLKEAIEEFKRVVSLAIKENPKIVSYYNIGNLYADLGEFENAIESYTQAIKLGPTLSKPRNNLGLAYAALGRTSEAEAEFAEAVRLKPDYAAAHYNLGVAYLLLGKKKEAEKEEGILTKLNPPLGEKLGRLLNPGP